MFKALSTIAVVGIASTNAHVHHEIDLFNPVNFLKASTPMNLIKNAISAAQGRLTDGTPVWTNCKTPPAVADFIDDPSSTYSQPATATKGINIALNLGGIMTESTDVTNVEINVLWNGTPLHKEEHPMDQKVDANGPFTYTLSWAIPSFAPSGHYHVDISLAGKAGNSVTDQSIGCVSADFDL